MSKIKNKIKLLKLNDDVIDFIKSNVAKFIFNESKKEWVNVDMFSLGKLKEAIKEWDLDSNRIKELKKVAKDIAKEDNLNINSLYCSWDNEEDIFVVGQHEDLINGMIEKRIRSKLFSENILEYQWAVEKSAVDFMHEEGLVLLKKAKEKQEKINLKKRNKAIKLDI